MTQPFSITGNDVGPQHQRVRYELSVLAFRLPDADKAAAGILPWVADPPTRTASYWAVGERSTGRWAD